MRVLAARTLQFPAQLPCGVLALLLTLAGPAAAAARSRGAPAAHPSCGAATADKSGAYPSFPGCLRKPPMGWMSWEIFRCDVDCADDPAACINAALYEQQTDAIVRGGYLAAGCG